MNQASCACAYVYDCCKLLRVFFRAADSPPSPPHSTPVFSSFTSLAGSLLPHTRVSFSFPTFPSPLSSVSLSAPRGACIHLRSKDARHRRVHRTSCSSCLLNLTDSTSRVLTRTFFFPSRELLRYSLRSLGFSITTEKRK